VPVHQCDEAIIVMALDEMNQLVSSDVFKARKRLFD
jgi:hypothetical protein